MNRERGRPQLRFGEQLLILLEKEWLQMVRDPAVIFMGALLPVVLIVLFGWGLSMDLLKVPAVFTAGESTALTAEVRAAFRGSPYFELTEVPSRHDAERLFAARRTEVIIDLPPGFTRDAAMGRAQIGLTVHGVDASAASIIRTYAAAVVAGLSQKIALREDFALLGSSAGPQAQTSGAAALLSRTWFNEANTSAWYLVPGLSIVVLTLSASFLVNFLLTAVGAMLAFFAAVFVFEVPVRGSLWLLAATILLYSAWAIAFGLLLSAVFKSQFTAIQFAVIGSYLPSLMLSGYLFDLRSVPWFISAVGRLMPPTYAIESVKILYLSGEPERIVLANLALLAAAALGFFALALVFARKRLD